MHESMNYSCARHPEKHHVEFGRLLDLSDLDKNSACSITRAAALTGSLFQRYEIGS